MTKRFLHFFTGVMMLSASFSCTEDIPDCPSKLCVISGGWKLTEVYTDDVKDNSDISQYQLILLMPSPTTETFSNFNRTQPSGNTDAGIWSLTNNETILRLIPDNNPNFTEDWIIESFTPRQLILVINRNTGIKQGPSKIRFVLEPF